MPDKRRRVDKKKQENINTNANEKIVSMRVISLNANIAKQSPFEHNTSVEGVTLSTEGKSKRVISFFRKKKGPNSTATTPSLAEGTEPPNSTSSTVMGVSTFPGAPLKAYNTAVSGQATGITVVPEHQCSTDNIIGIVNTNNAHCARPLNELSILSNGGAGILDVMNNGMFSQQHTMTTACCASPILETGMLEMGLSKAGDKSVATVISQVEDNLLNNSDPKYFYTVYSPAFLYKGKCVTLSNTIADATNTNRVNRNLSRVSSLPNAEPLKRFINNKSFSGFDGLKASASCNSLESLVNMSSPGKPIGRITPLLRHRFLKIELPRSDINVRLMLFFNLCKLQQPSKYSILNEILSQHNYQLASSNEIGQRERVGGVSEELFLFFKNILTMATPGDSFKVNFNTVIAGIGSPFAAAMSALIDEKDIKNNNGISDEKLFNNLQLRLNALFFKIGNDGIGSGMQSAIPGLPVSGYFPATSRMSSIGSSIGTFPVRDFSLSEHLGPHSSNRSLTTVSLGMINRSGLPSLTNFNLTADNSSHKPSTAHMGSGRGCGTTPATTSGQSELWHKNSGHDGGAAGGVAGCAVWSPLSMGPTSVSDSFLEPGAVNDNSQQHPRGHRTPMDANHGPTNLLLQQQLQHQQPNGCPFSSGGGGVLSTGMNLEIVMTAAGKDGAGSDVSFLKDTSRDVGGCFMHVPLAAAARACRRESESGSTNSGAQQPTDSPTSVCVSLGSGGGLAQHALHSSNSNLLALLPPPLPVRYSRKIPVIPLYKKLQLEQRSREAKAEATALKTAEQVKNKEKAAMHHASSAADFTQFNENETEMQPSVNNNKNNKDKPSAAARVKGETFDGSLAVKNLELLSHVVNYAGLSCLEPMCFDYALDIQLNGSAHDEENSKLGEGTYGIVFGGCKLTIKERQDIRRALAANRRDDIALGAYSFKTDVQRERIAVKMIKQLPGHDGFLPPSIREIYIHAFFASMPECDRPHLAIMDDLRFEWNNEAEADAVGKVDENQMSITQKSHNAQRAPPGYVKVGSKYIRKGCTVLQVKTFLIFPYCPFTLDSLMDEIRRNPAESPLRIDEDFVLAMFYQILLGIQTLHHAGIMHRDLKPNNCLITHDGTLRICDFGLSISSRTNRETQTPKVISYPYRPPEMLLGEGNRYDMPVDIWSAGCILLQMFLGYHPFAINALRNTPEEIKKAEMEHVKLLVQIFGPLPLNLVENAIQKPLEREQLIQTGLVDLSGPKAAKNYPKYVQEVRVCQARFDSFDQWFDAILRARQTRCAHDSKHRGPIDGRVSDDLVHLLSRLLTLDPAKRDKVDTLLLGQGWIYRAKKAMRRVHHGIRVFYERTRGKQ